MSGESTSRGFMCARCGLEIGGASIWEGHLSYHPDCAPSNIQVPMSVGVSEDAIMAAATVVWEAEKADVIARLSKALGVTGPVTLEGMLQEVEGRLREANEFWQKLRDEGVVWKGEG